MDGPSGQQQSRRHIDQRSGEQLQPFKDVCRLVFLVVSISSCNVIVRLPLSSSSSNVQTSSSCAGLWFRAALPDRAEGGATREEPESPARGASAALPGSSPPSFPTLLPHHSYRTSIPCFLHHAIHCRPAHCRGAHCQWHALLRLIATLFLSTIFYLGAVAVDAQRPHRPLRSGFARYRLCDASQLSSHLLHESCSDCCKAKPSRSENHSQHTVR